MRRVVTFGDNHTVSLFDALRATYQAFCKEHRACFGERKMETDTVDFFSIFRPSLSIFNVVDVKAAARWM